MYNPFFKLQRWWFIQKLPKKTRQRYCLKHFTDNHYEYCRQCSDEERVERQAVESRMAYYHMALRDREMADVLLAEGTLPLVDHHGLLGGQGIREPEGGIAGFHLNEVGERVQDFGPDVDENPRWTVQDPAQQVAGDIVPDGGAFAVDPFVDAPLIPQEDMLRAAGILDRHRDF